MNFEKDAQESLSPDCWNGKWSQVNRFGGGQAVEYEVGELLHAFVRSTKPRVVVETGTHKGFSALMIGSALKKNGGGHLYSVDIQDYGAEAEVFKYELSPFVSIVKGDGKIVIQEIAAVSKIDFLWLDADHSAESVLAEFRAGLPALRSGSYVAFHDTLTDPREAAAVVQILEEHPSWQHLHFATARGFDILRVT